jgi:hypothetical protein
MRHVDEYGLLLICPAIFTLLAARHLQRRLPHPVANLLTRRQAFNVAWWYTAPVPASSTTCSLDGVGITGGE